MNKKFSRIIFSFALAFAMILPMFATTASAQVTRTRADVIFITRINQQVALFNDLLLQTETLFGPTRTFFLTGTMLGLTPGQIQLQMGGFGVDLNTFVVSSLIARQINVPVNRIIQLNASGRSFGEIALGLNASLNLTVTSIRVFIDLFNAEIGAGNGGNGDAETDDDLIAVLTRLLELIDSRFDTLQVRLGNVTFEAIIIARLSVETNTPIDVITDFRNRFSNLGIDDFSTRFLLANTISAATLQELEDLGFVFEDVTVVTPLGVGRVLGAFGVPTQVFVARVDVFQRLVRADSNGTTPPPDPGA